MFRKIIAGTAVAGALTLGMAGIAGASTGSTGNTGPAITGSTTVCSLLPQIQDRVQKLESKLAADLPKAQAREAKAKAAGHTKLADWHCQPHHEDPGPRDQGQHAPGQAQRSVLDRRFRAS